MFGNFVSDVKIICNNLKELNGSAASDVGLANDFTRAVRDLNNLALEMAEIPVFKRLGKLNPWLAIVKRFG